MHNSFLQLAASLSENKQPYATAYIVRRKIPSSGKPGDKAIITADGQIHGWIGGGCTRGIVLKEALEALKDGKPRFVAISPDKIDSGDYESTKVYAMTCQSGGEVEVYIEPVLPRPSLVIFGTSHIAMALARIAKAMDYHVSAVVNHVDRAVYPDVDNLEDIADFTGKQLSPQTYAVVCTQGEADALALKKALEANMPYLSFVASRRKANAIFGELRTLGIGFDQLKSIKTPAGLDINAKLPEEVAISILAEIISDFRKDDKAAAPVQEERGQFPNPDFYMNPVCNIPVQKSTAKHVLEYAGEQVYFCCDGCKTKFEENPAQYLPEAVLEPAGKH